MFLSPGLFVFSAKCFVHAKSLQLCLTLCDSVDYSPSGSSVHGILQARILSGLPWPSPGDLPNPEISYSLLHFHCHHTDSIFIASHRQKCTPTCCNHKIIFKAKYYYSPSSSWENNCPLGWESHFHPEEREGDSMPCLLSSCKSGQSMSVRLDTRTHCKRHLAAGPARVSREWVWAGQWGLQASQTHAYVGKICSLLTLLSLISSRKKAQFGLTCL